MATILTDTFDAYNDGDLNGQGSWAGITDFDIQTTIKKEGTKGVAIVNPAEGGEMKKTGDALAAGTIGCYMRTSVNNANTVSFWIMGDTKYAGSIDFRSDGHIYGEQSGGSDVDLGAYSVDTWYWCQIEWQTTPANQVRYKIDNGAWSDWQGAYQTWTTNPNIIRYYAYAGTYSAYIDYISETSLTVAYTLTTSVGEFVLTGVNATLTEVELPLWSYGTKNASSWTAGTKNSASWTAGTKNTTTWANASKST